MVTFRMFRRPLKIQDWSWLPVDSGSIKSTYFSYACKMVTGQGGNQDQHCQRDSSRDCPSSLLVHACHCVSSSGPECNSVWSNQKTTHLNAHMSWACVLNTTNNIQQVWMSNPGSWPTAALAFSLLMNIAPTSPMSSLTMPLLIVSLSFASHHKQFMSFKVSRLAPAMTTLNQLY